MLMLAGIRHFVRLLSNYAPGSLTEHAFRYCDIKTKKAAADTKYAKTATGKVRLYKRKTQRGDKVHASRRSIIRYVLLALLYMKM